MSAFTAGEKLCGVGITFVEDSNGALYVKSLVRGGSAALSGQIQVVIFKQPVASMISKSLHFQVGDVLYEVNEKNVYCMNPELIGGLLLGYEGTQVS